MGKKSATCLNLTSSDFRPIGEQEAMALSSAVKTHDELVCRLSGMEPMPEWYGGAKTPMEELRNVEVEA